MFQYSDFYQQVTHDFCDKFSQTFCTCNAYLLFCPFSRRYFIIQDLENCFLLFIVFQSFEVKLYFFQKYFLIITINQKNYFTKFLHKRLKLKIKTKV